MTMKKALLIAFAVMLAASAWGQYIPNNAQTFQFMPLLNPAFTGVESFSDLKFSYRYQWAGFGSYSPKFVNLGYSTRLVKPLDLSHNSLRTSDPTALNAENLPVSKRMIHGLGANIFHSSIGVLESIGGGINYAINYPLGTKTRLAFGGALLIENRKLNVGELEVRDPDSFYDHLLSGATSQTELNVRAGALVYSQTFYIGISYLPILFTPIQKSDLAMTEPFYRGSVQAGFTLRLNPDVILKPSVVGLVKMDNDVVLDYHIKAYFRENIWFGLSYRDIKSGMGLVGWNFNERLSASYSYEMSLGEFRQFNDGSHELVLSLRMNNFRKYSQYTW